MAKINDGGPAFPCDNGKWDEGQWCPSPHSGMSLRQYYIGEAMKSLISMVKYDDVIDIAFSFADDIIAHEAKEKNDSEKAQAEA